MLPTPEPDTFSTCQYVTTRVDCAKLFRLSKQPGTEPFWGRSTSYRFDDPLPQADRRYGVLYCAEDLPTAFAESVIHSAPFLGGAFQVSSQELRGRSLVKYHRPGPSSSQVLELLDLTGDGLKNLGLNNDICAGDDYTIPHLWSRAAYEQLPHVDGIRYVSRQRNRHFCYALFERSGLVRRDAALLTDVDLSILRWMFRVREVV